MVFRSDIRRVLPVRDVTLPLGERTYVMGVLNATPDSFSDGGKYLSAEAAVTRARVMIKEGCGKEEKKRPKQWAAWLNRGARAHILDIGGQSTKPDAVQVGVDEELKRYPFCLFGCSHAQPNLK